MTFFKILGRLFCNHKWRYLTREYYELDFSKYKGRKCVKCHKYESRPVVGLELWYRGWWEDEAKRERRK